MPTVQISKRKNIIYDYPKCQVVAVFSLSKVMSWEITTTPKNSKVNVGLNPTLIFECWLGNPNSVVSILEYPEPLKAPLG